MSTTLAQKEACALCDQAIQDQTIREGEHLFCCHGCQAVFNILSSQGALEGFDENPLFKQAVASGLISNPALVEEMRRRSRERDEEDVEKLHFEVGEMWCPSCAELIKLMLLQEKGIYHCVVDYATDLAVVEFSLRKTSKEAIFKVVSKLGYQPRTLEDSRHQKVGRLLYLRFGIAAFCALNVMMFAYPIYASYFSLDTAKMVPAFIKLSFFTSLPVLTFSAWPIFRRFWTSAQVGLFGMETLVTMGVASAFTLSVYEMWQGGKHVYFDSMNVIIAFVLLGKIIESRAKFSAKDSLIQLNRSLPRRGRRKRPGQEAAFVPLKEIEVGDEVVVLTGEKIVLDGVVVEGEGSCDESLMTGESIPVFKQGGDKVLGGTLLKQGWLTFRVTASAETSALQKIIEMVEQDIGNKSVYVRIIDQVVRYFVPAVMGLATLSGLACYWNGGEAAAAVTRGISVLLISCPCAIGIAAPLAESQLINALAKLGAIVRNRGCLPLLGELDTFVFDKTGTVTEGRFKVISGLESLSPTQLKALKALAQQSTHPISVAVAEAIDVEPSLVFSGVEEVIGKGVTAELHGKKMGLGSAALVEAMAGRVPALEEGEGSVVSTVYVIEEGQCLTALKLGDTLRSDVTSTLKALRPAQSALLSGDSEAPVKAVAQTCGFDRWIARANPLEKSVFVQDLRKAGRKVAMVGDGINDAPSLTAADVGISVVSASDVSIQVSDVLLTSERLQAIPEIVYRARRGQKIVKQNLFWAFSYNLLGIGMACYGVLSPLFAAIAMVSSSLIVLFNASRAARGPTLGASDDPFDTNR